jgi:hypothetical protein
MVDLYTIHRGRCLDEQCSSLLYLVEAAFCAFTLNERRYPDSLIDERSPTENVRYLFLIARAQEKLIYHQSLP